MKRIIFYHPHFLPDNPVKGSGLHPLSMKNAFESIGYEVELVIGDSVHRKKSIKKIKSNINAGIKYEFLFAESSNLPAPISDPHHIPLRPLLDYNFFRFLKKKSVPVGLFYMDIYWRFKEFNYHTSIKYIIKLLFHWIEWKGILKTVDHLFLPTESLAKYLPNKWSNQNLSALYPGFNEEISKTSIVSNNKELNLLYVGGVKPPYYDIRPVLEAVNQVENVKLTICTRDYEWEQNKSFYKNYDFQNINIVHVASKELSDYYQSSNIVLDIRKPEGYLKTALPMKIIGAMGHDVPLVVYDGTESADFVKKENIGWVVLDLDQVIILLKKINKNRELLDKKVKTIKEVKMNHTWEKRAIQTAEILSKYNIRH